MPIATAVRRLVTRSALGLPTPVLRAIAGGQPTIAGRTLDPQLAAALRLSRFVVPRFERLPVAAARAAARTTFEAFAAPPVAMARVLDEQAPGPAGAIPVRVYVPRRHHGGLLVYFHGGGGVIGSIAAYDAFARDLADRSGCALASVEYRLAPEHPHPAAIDDAVAVWPWAVTQAARWGVDPSRIAVGGDSFGGFLAAWVERRGHATGRPRPRRVVLIYPLLDLTMGWPSYQQFADGFGLTLPLIHWFRGHYAPDRASWRQASPLHHDDVREVAPTLLVAAGFDALHDEGQAWADRVTAAGGAVVRRCHDSLIHGFIDMTGVCRAARVAVDELAADLAAL